MTKIKVNNSVELLKEIQKALKTISYGSVEIYIQDGKVTQLTVRKIVKTKYDIHKEDNVNSRQSINVNTIQIRQNRVLTKKNE